MGGEMALSGVQLGWEATSGTLVPATRADPILQGNIVEHVERDFPDEQRNSFIANYRNFALKNYVEVAGVQIRPTFEGLPAWLRLFLKGISLTGAVVGVTGASYVFSPTATSNDLITGTGEFFDPTQCYGVPYLLGNKLELGFAKNGPMTCSMDFLGQKAVPQSKTGALTIGAYEDIIGAAATVKIDTTTIGTTPVYTVLDAKFTIDNGYIQDFVMDGNLYARGAHRGKTRYMALDMTLQFLDTTEYTLFQNSSIGTPRKIRLSVDGTNISGSTGPLKRNLMIDWYGVWETAAFDSSDGMRTVKLSGRSQFDATATYDWKVTVQNGLVVTP